MRSRFWLFALIAVVLLVSAAVSVTLAQTSVPSSPPGIMNLATPVPGQVAVMLPKDAMLVVATTESLNSYSAHEGERIRYQVTQDFIVGGYLISKAGDIAEGQVEEGQAGDTGAFDIGYKAANLRVSVDRLYTFCGSTIEPSFDRSEYRRRQGLFGSNKDVTVVKGQKYGPIVDHPQQACAVKTDEQPQPVGSDVLLSDKG